MESQLQYMVSLPMKGRTEDEIRRDFDIIEAMMKLNYGENCTRLETLSAVGKNDPLMGLSHAIEVMSQADIVVFAGDFSKHRGCAIEHKIAKQYHKPIVYFP